MSLQNPVFYVRLGSSYLQGFVVIGAVWGPQQKDACRYTKPDAELIVERLGPVLGGPRATIEPVDPEGQAYLFGEGSHKLEKYP